MGTDEVMRKTLELAQSQLSNYKTVTESSKVQKPQQSAEKQKNQANQQGQLKKQVA